MIQNLKLKRCKKKKVIILIILTIIMRIQGFTNDLKDWALRLFYQDLRELRYTSNMAELSFTSISGLESHTIALKER